MEDISKASNYGVEEKNIQGKVNHEDKCEEVREILQAFQPVLFRWRRTKRERGRGRRVGGGRWGSDTADTGIDSEN